MSEKIRSLDALADTVRGLRGSGKRVVHVRGTFDLLQPVHVARLEAARKDGDALVLTVRSDKHLADERPVLDESLRASILAALPCVDFVAVEDRRSGDEVIRTVGADLCVPGVEGAGSAPKPIDDDGAAPYSPAGRAFLRDFRGRFSADEIVERLESLKKLRVLVLGDTIIDEYHFVRPYGMPLKAPIIAAQFLDGEAHAGGILAVANHLAGFCGEVHLVTSLGANDSREDFVRRHLRSNVSSQFIFRPGAPTTVKRRYVRRFLVQKLFEVSFFDDTPLPRELDIEASRHLSRVAADYDLVVVADFGQGFVSRNMIDVVCGRSRFLAVNAQMNSINMGFHLVTRYPRADYVCIDEDEMRLACRDRYSPVHDLIRQLAGELECGFITVTRGHHGSLTFQSGKGMTEVPVLSREVVDTVGAGDAYLAVTAPCVASGFPPEMVGFIGNAVGALAVKILGNQQPVAPEMLYESIRSLLR